MSLGLYDLAGGLFLEFYVALLALTIVAGYRIPRWIRPGGYEGRVTDTGEFAYLAGGKARFTDSVVARLLATRALALVGEKGFQALTRGAGRGAVELSVLALPGEVSWKEISRSLESHAEPIERRLVADCLMMDARLTRQTRFWQTLPYFLLLLFGAIKLIVDEMYHRPVSYLVLLLILTAILALIRWLVVDRRTRGGVAALNEARSRAARLKLAPTAPETELAVALFGTVVLVGSGWSGFHKLRTASVGAGGSSSGCGGDAS
ncbi:MAG: TIGR04222 domain-containing membrane protein [Sphingomonas sp.]